MEDKTVVTRYGPYWVIEGDVDGVTWCWVERDGQRVSAYGNIDYADETASAMYDESPR